MNTGRHFYQPLSHCFSILPYRRIEQVHLEQIIVSDADPAVFDEAFHFIDDWAEVFALVNIICLESVLLEVLYQVLRTISVVPDFQRQDLILFHQHPEPVEAIVIVDEVVPRLLKQAALDECSVWHSVPGRGFVYLLPRQEELREDIQLPLLLNDCAAGCQICRPGQVYASHAVAASEILELQLRADALRNILAVEPSLATVLLYVAILSQELRFL